MITIEQIIIASVFVFVAGIVDSIAGGGGLISLPGYLLCQIPVHNALATNKASSTFGTLISFIRYYKNKSIHMYAASIGAIGALLGSFVGSYLVLLIDPNLLKPILIIVLPVITIFISFQKWNVEKDVGITKKTYVIIFLWSIVIGCYDGMLGPGTGTFLVILFCFLGFDMKTASGNAKLINLASNVAAFTTFLFSGKIIFELAIFTTIAGILGNYIGSGLAIKNGSKIIKPVLYFVMILLIFKFISDFL